MDAIKKQCGVCWDMWLFIIGMLFAAFLFGFGLNLFVARVLSEGAICGLGTVLSLVVFIVFQLLSGGNSVAQTFNLMAGMCMTRRGFLLSGAVVNAAFNLLGGIVIKLLYGPERYLVAALRLPVEDTVDFSGALQIRYLIAAAVLLAAFQMFFGALVQKYEQTAFWILWTLCVGGGMACSRAGEMFHAGGDVKLPVWSGDLFLPLAFAVAAACFAGAWAVLKKAQVN